MIMVTGGAGFIGCNFIHDWLELTNEPLLNIDKLTYAGNLDSLSEFESHESYEFVQGCISNSELLTKLFDKYRPRAIINFAAESHVDRSISDPEIFVETNVVAVFRLLEVARNYHDNLRESKNEFRFLHVSTDEVFGTLGPTESPFTERSAYKPNSAYSASKASSDHFVRAWYETYGLPTVITNCSNNYGPFQFPEKLIPVVIQNAINGLALPVYGDGRQVRDWLHVSDHCAALRCVLANGSPGQSYNIGGDNEIQNIELVKTVCHLLDEMHSRADGRQYQEQIEFVEDRLGHDRRYAIDFSKIRSELNWAPIYTFDVGIRKTIKWYLDNSKWLGRIASGAYAKS